MVVIMIMIIIMVVMLMIMIIIIIITIIMKIMVQVQAWQEEMQRWRPTVGQALPLPRFVIMAIVVIIISFVIINGPVLFINIIS